MIGRWCYRLVCWLDALFVCQHEEQLRDIDPETGALSLVCTQCGDRTVILHKSNVVPMTRRRA